MRILAKRKVLVAYRKRGTFIGPEIHGPHTTTKTRTVHMLIRYCKENLKGFSFDTAISGICSAMHEVNVQCGFFPNSNSVPFIRQTLGNVRAEGELVGITIGSPTPEIYDFLTNFENSKIPTVVLGSTYLGKPAIPSIDIDQREAGRLLTQHLIDRGHRRIVLLTHAEDHPGDNYFIDGVTAALSTSQLRHGDLVVRFARNDHAIAPIMEELLQRTSDRPTAVITRMPGHAELVAKIASALGINISKDLEVVFQYHCFDRDAGLSFAHVTPDLSAEDIGVLLGKMLDSLSKGEPLETNSVIVPVRLCLPRSSE